jgi:hypothetical protein
MPFIQRDSSGRVMALFAEAPAPQSSWLEAGDPEIVAFLAGAATQDREEDAQDQVEGAKRRLAAMDVSMIRVLEDLLDVLISKHVILLTDLPEDAQRKMNSRKLTRRNLLADVAGMSPPSREIF